jgi:uncharacterized protein (DUF2236 family)
VRHNFTLDRRARHDDAADVPDALEARLLRGLMLAPASANVVMQLSRRGIGRAVAESRVSSGSLVRHPVKRTRTTLAYIWTSLYGTDDQRGQLRHSVNAQHRHVRSRPDDEVAYDAFDIELQLWVAACMYLGCLQGYVTLYGPVADDVADTLFERCSRFATTLQVPAHRWPSDRTAFANYWDSVIGDIEVDDVTSLYLRDFIDLRYLPRPVGYVLRPLNRLLTGGYLLPPFRDALGIVWRPVEQRRFDQAVAMMRWINRVLPSSIATLPWNLVRHDTLRRLARQRPLM